MEHETDFPRVTTSVLDVHTDEVWVLDWSRDGNFLASASKDKSAIIWGIEPETKMGTRNWEKRHVLPHPFNVHSLAWSFDDKILATGAGESIKMWNTETGTCIRTLQEHSEPVTALCWLPDGSGFLSAGMDFKIVIWNMDGHRRETWGISLRIVDMVLSPDFTRLVVIGMRAPSPVDPRADDDGTPSGMNGGASTLSPSPKEEQGFFTSSPPPKDEQRLLVFDFASRRNEPSVLFEGDLTCLSVSQNSQHVLISRSPDDLQLWDLTLGRAVRTYSGHRQSKDIIRSCFGGFDNRFVVSGSEDGNVYVWYRDTGGLLRVLKGHGEGSVNCVAWNPCNERMFASCSDDHTIRIWEAAPPA
ncbi:WD40-repeat-containing domain protein [Mycena vulgaris]|nr:WD40-repeat-containing domain protein [Mycena vulgaris]